MKTFRSLYFLSIVFVLFTSCTTINNNYIDEELISLEEVIQSYDLWYVDYHKTEGNGDVPFVSRAFTLSFLGGRIYANNNIVDIGKRGNGLGVKIGSYTTRNGTLEVNHELDNYYDFDVVQLSNSQLRLDFEGVSYYLEGYTVDNFDYDKLFYENIEYLLQEFTFWQKNSVKNGAVNPFDKENFLKFTPEDNTTFYSSKDDINIRNIRWDFIGKYEIFDVQEYDDLKVVKLYYDDGDEEEFELSIIEDDKIELYHISSKTTYTFWGKGFLQYRKSGKKARKRTKIKRLKVAKKTAQL